MDKARWPHSDALHTQACGRVSVALDKLMSALLQEGIRLLLSTTNGVTGLDLPPDLKQVGNRAKCVHQWVPRLWRSSKEDPGESRKQGHKGSHLFRQWKY